MKNLSKNPLFAHISAADIDRMMTCFDAQKKTFQTKDIIPTCEDTQNFVCLLTEGAVSVNRISIDGSLDILEYLEDTGIFGASFAYANREEEFIAICEKDCSVLFIEQQRLTRRCEKACPCHTQVIENLIERMAHEVMHLTEKVEILSHRSIRGKLMCYFRIQSTKQGQLTFRLPMSLLKLANYLCIDRSAMMRELKKMKEEEIVEINAGEVTLL